jgi:DNA-directed RNA polymerase sigma subunit (sigma70/sigma32)
VGDLLSVLDEREKKIIYSVRSRCGKAKTLEEVGKKFGVTRERMSSVGRTSR